MMPFFLLVIKYVSADSQYYVADPEVQHVPVKGVVEQGNEGLAVLSRGLTWNKYS